MDALLNLGEYARAAGLLGTAGGAAGVAEMASRREATEYLGDPVRLEARDMPRGEPRGDARPRGDGSRCTLAPSKSCNGRS